MTNCTIYDHSGDAVFMAPGYSHGSGAYLALTNTIIANTSGGVAVSTCDTDCELVMECCCLWQNEYGDFVGGIAGQEGINGNFLACPSFCYGDDADFHLCDESPCLPGNHPDSYECGLIGAWGEGCGCGPTRANATTWGAIKSMYR
jgi:hypothetical protein